MGASRSFRDVECRGKGQRRALPPSGHERAIDAMPDDDPASTASVKISSDKLTPALDLFGDPIRPRLGLAGRPRHVPTKALRKKVAELHARGKGQLEIAAAIGISAPTLRLNYVSELESKSQVWRLRIERERKE